jgi:hypothetical protein
LPVLPGWVVPASASRAAFALGAEALEARGSGGARLVVGAADVPDSLSTVVGDRLVVRSSSRLEAGGEWAGAFTSYVDIPASDLSTAVRGCWASAFSVDALRRFEAAGVAPGSSPMAVLIQPFVEAVAGGAARLDASSEVSVVGTPGSPVAVLQGWEPGVVARVTPKGVVAGAEARRVLGEDVLRLVATSLRDAAGRIGATAIEWAFADGGVVVLQLGRAPVDVEAARPPAPDGLRHPLAVAIARLVRRAPGPLGEELILPWAVAAPDLVADLLDTVPPEARPVRSLPPGVSPSVLADLRGPDPHDALRRIAELPSTDPELAREVVAAFKARRRETRPLGRTGIDRWEPFSAAVTMANAEPIRGVSASVGLGAGRLAWVPDPRHASAFRSRDVLVAPRPLPQLAPLLWDATGVVTLGGGPAAHLLESARALGIPAVTGIDGSALGPLPPDEPLCLAIDGWTGDVYAVPW